MGAHVAAADNAHDNDNAHVHVHAQVNAGGRQPALVLGRGGGFREADLELGALPWRADDADFSAVGPHDLID